ncbi:hypothetical protein LTS18_005979 [Coniosporium uncinatum]|uniref:Uncharacterized protein n=1 Tax=Coniosporium uncinatum TaxID=93489 RepID=A0ACC3DAW9_9PEZI|nr:hypothetical protein LTS18_005979 [Coniosporium uncinatum]
MPTRAQQHVAHLDALIAQNLCNAQDLQALLSQINAGTATGSALTAVSPSYAQKKNLHDKTYNIPITVSQLQTTNNINKANTQRIKHLITCASSSTSSTTRTSTEPRPQQRRRKRSIEHDDITAETDQDPKLPEPKRRKVFSEPPQPPSPLPPQQQQHHQQDDQPTSASSVDPTPAPAVTAPQRRLLIQFEDISAEVTRRLVEQKRRNGWIDPMTRDPVPQTGSGSGYGSGYDGFGKGRKVVARKRRAVDEDLVEEEGRVGVGMGEERATDEEFKVPGRKVRRVRGEFVEEEL